MPQALVFLAPLLLIIGLSEFTKVEPRKPLPLRWRMKGESRMVGVLRERRSLVQLYITSRINSLFTRAIALPNIFSHQSQFNQSCKQNNPIYSPHHNEPEGLTAFCWKKPDSRLNKYMQDLELTKLGRQALDHFCL